MKIPAKEWILFLLIAALSCLIWYKLGYTQFKFVDLSVDKNAALQRAEKYLRSRGVDPTGYLRAIVFTADDWSDRYLQKTLGLQAEEEFIRKHNYELFSWQIRFFKEFQKEEYVIGVSPKSGQIFNFSHLIEDIEARADTGEDTAKQVAEEFLRSICGIELKDYEFHEENIKRYEKRIDYNFSWEKKKVYIPWQEGQGGAKLLIGITVSGKEIREFYNDRLDIPERFQRFIENQLTLGEYLYVFYFLFFIALIGWSTYLVMKRQNTLVVRNCKKLYIYLGGFFVIIHLIYLFNNLQNIIINYPTSTSLSSFIGVYLIKFFTSLIFVSVAFILPGLAGESLYSEVMPENKYGCLLHYVRSNFFTRQTSKSIFFGSIVFFILLGIQAIMFYIGQRYFGVWREWIRLTQLSSAYIPFLSAFVIASRASLSEEIIFRLFGISWVKKYFKNTILAVVIMSLLWGLGHSAYAIFPVWFRSIEVGVLGLVLGFVFLRYGIIAAITAHYLFDTFWGVAVYILGRSTSYLFVGSLAALIIPLIFALIAFIINKEDREREINLMLDEMQRYNLEILTTFVTMKKSQGLSVTQIKQELIAHNWDNMLVDLAIEEILKS